MTPWEPATPQANASRGDERCSLEQLTGDLCRKGFPSQEVLPAATLAVLAGTLEILPGDIVSVVDAGERVAA